VKQFIKEVTNKNWCLSSVKTLLSTIDQNGFVDRKMTAENKL